MIPRSLDVPPLTDRQVILLATATITDDNIFANGLFQNVHTLYRMFDAMGYASILLINTKPTTLEKIPAPLRICRMITTEDLMRQRVKNLLGMIEIGMSLDAGVRKFIRTLGGKRWKLYLGNILNIDIETPMFYPNHFFPHHVAGELDAIWVSPHYLQHAEYAACINGLAPPPDLSTMIAPYVWDPAIFDMGGKREWEKALANEAIVIMEPNISFQKSAFVPLLIVEEWRRANPDWKGQVIVVNGDRLQTPHFKASVAPLLGEIVYLPRQDIRSVLSEFPSATFILHNVNNEFNYMTLELLWAGFPVIHNSPTWSPYGYYYGGIKEGVKQLEMAMSHGDRLETYKAHAAAIAWRYSPYNPELQAAWNTLLK